MGAKQQTEKIANFIMKHYPDDIIEGGVADTTIDILDKHLVTLKNMKELLEIQSKDGNWNYDSYTLGLYNGMEAMLACAEHREPKFRDSPDTWIRDRQGVSFNEM